MYPNNIYTTACMVQIATQVVFPQRLANWWSYNICLCIQINCQVSTVHQITKQWIVHNKGGCGRGITRHIVYLHLLHLLLLCLTLLLVLRYICSGFVPTSICDISSLTAFDFHGNDQIACYADCLSNVPSMNAGNVAMCSSYQDVAVCGLVAATDIASKSQYDAWSCNASGFPSSSPCDTTTAVWTGITCVDGMIVELAIAHVGIAGDVCISSPSYARQ